MLFPFPRSPQECGASSYVFLFGGLEKILSLLCDPENVQKA
jgi:hypothetical protein